MSSRPWSIWEGCGGTNPDSISIAAAHTIDRGSYASNRDVAASHCWSVKCTFISEFYTGQRLVRHRIDIYIYIYIYIYTVYTGPQSPKDGYRSRLARNCTYMGVSTGKRTSG